MQDINEIQLQMHAPCTELIGFVQTIWFATNTSNKQTLSFKILNDCASGFIFNFGDEINLKMKGVNQVSQKEYLLLGPTTDMLTLTFKNEINCIGIRFFPETGHHFLNVEMSQLANKIIFRYKSHFETGSVLYKDIKQLLDKKADKKDVIHIIEAYLLHVLKKSKVKIHHKLNNILKAIQNDQGINISKISHDFKISHRDLQRLFKRYIGVAPNVYIRINKIRNLKTIIANNRFDSLTQLSLDNGYFDQAHFIRDFKGFMQETPKKYYKIKNPN